MDKLGKIAGSDIFPELINRNQLIAEHSQRVALISIQIGQALGLDKAALRDLEFGSLLHDIGKLGINQSILKKPGKLTQDEFKLVQTHTILGGNFVEAVGYKDSIIEIVLYHHERLDGSGYPFGKKEDGLPLTSRIVAVADVFEAMTADRPYRSALSVEEALAELDQHDKYDQIVVQALRSKLDLTERKPAKEPIDRAVIQPS